jgi:hypothetical protein
MRIEDTITSLPPKHYNFGIRVKKGLVGLGGEEGQIIPYVCAQVAHQGRGSIGIDEDGNVVFHLPIERQDQIAHLGLVTAEEIWIVLKAHPSLTDPLHERRIVL